jgi:hypothetical protein
MKTYCLKKKLAQDLLKFIHQSDDLENIAVLKHVIKSKTAEVKTPTAILPKKVQAPLKPQASVDSKTLPDLNKSPQKQEVKTIKFDLYQKLVDKVKKACPELNLRQSVEIQQVQIPDCDVLLLCQKNIPEVYQGLIKAIDKQLGLAETILMDVSLIPDLTQRHFKLILAPPFLTKWPSFMKQVRQTGKKSHFLGSSQLIFLDDEKELASDIKLKSSLWNQIKTLFA